MSTPDSDLAVFRGSRTSPGWKEWNELPGDERRAGERVGIMPVLPTPGA